MHGDSKTFGPFPSTDLNHHNEKRLLVASSGVADAFQQEIWKRFSKEEYPHRDLSTALRSGRDDKGESGCGPKQNLWKVDGLLQRKIFRR
jgi:hypothetical protein